MKRKYLVLIILLLIVTNITSVLYLKVNSKDKTFEKSVNTYPLVDPLRNYLEQENYIVNVQPLRGELNTLVDEFGRENVSIYIEFLNTGSNISINPEVYIWSASLPKLPLAMSVMKKVEYGTWKMDNELVLMPIDKDDKSGSEDGSLWEYPVGTRFTVEKLLEELLVNSDNTAQKILFRNMHSDEIEKVTNDLGLEKLFNQDGKMSAKEYSRFFRSLYSASFLARDSSQKLLEWLDKSSFNQFLSNPIGSEISFPHKYGENVLQRAYADSGIVYLPNRPYLITVMVQGSEELSIDEDIQRTEKFMRQVSKLTYDYFINY